MTSRTWVMTGAAVTAAGVLMMGMALARPGVAHAVPAECFQTPFATTNQGDAGILAQADSVVPRCTETPSSTPQRRLKTHTPTATPTEAPKTNTPEPPTATVTPTNTPKAASEAVSVKPPNTGSGDGVSGGPAWWLLALGGASVVLGGGAIATGVRRR